MSASDLESLSGASDVESMQDDDEDKEARPGIDAAVLMELIDKHEDLPAELEDFMRYDLAPMQCNDAVDIEVSIGASSAHACDSDAGNVFDKIMASAYVPARLVRLDALHFKIVSPTSAVNCEMKDKCAVQDKLLNMFVLQYFRPIFGGGGNGGSEGDGEGGVDGGGGGGSGGGGRGGGDDGGSVGCEGGGGDGGADGGGDGGGGGGGGGDGGGGGGGDCGGGDGGGHGGCDSPTVPAFLYEGVGARIEVFDIGRFVHTASCRTSCLPWLRHMHPTTVSFFPFQDSG